MTPDERNMLNDLADKVSQMPAGARDPEAEEIIRTKIGKRPDALYLMTQTVLIQNLALQRAQQQIDDLQRRASQAQVGGGGSSWLGQPSGSYSGGQQAQYSGPPQQQYAPPPSSFGGGGFLRGAAQTAAGVAAGTLAAEAIGSMFSHHGGGFLGGNEFVGGSSVAPSEVVNNYYDSPGGDSGLYPSGDRDDNFVDPANASGVDDSGTFADDSDTLASDDSQFDDSGLDTGDGGFDTGSDDTYV